MQKLASFPGLPTVKFLITCSMQNQRGEAGPFYYVNDVSVDLGRQRGGGVLIGLFLEFLSQALEFQIFTKTKNIPLLVQDREHMHNQGPLPSSVYIPRYIDIDVIHIIKWTRPNSPSIAFAYCKRSKTGWWEGLGMRLC